LLITVETCGTRPVRADIMKLVDACRSTMTLTSVSASFMIADMVALIAARLADSMEDRLRGHPPNLLIPA